MGEAKHTPGPWGPNTRVPVRGNAVQIEWLCAVEPDSPRDLEARANARLIAAAPELYEALSNLADILEHDCDCPPCVGSDAPAEHWLGMARAAIAKSGASA